MNPLMELKERLSRRETKAITDKTAQIVDCVSTISAEPFGQEIPYRHRRWKLVDRLGEQVIRSLIEERQRGTTVPLLVERFGISRSSVKRILKRAR